MYILTLRTDRPEAFVALYDNDSLLTGKDWLAHRQLAETLHLTINSVLVEAGHKLQAIEGILFYKGPGSFTGLRIGASVANALAYAGDIPIVATTGDDWLEAGLKALRSGANDKIAVPDYGAEPHITQPRR